MRCSDPHMQLQYTCHQWLSFRRTRKFLSLVNLVWRKSFVMRESHMWEEQLSWSTDSTVRTTDSETGQKDVNDNTLEPFQPSSYTPDPSIGAVLCGLDMAINYTKLSKAFIHLNTDPSCLFLATNTDSTYPAQGGVLLPGAGSISAPLRFALGREPLSLGKPSQVMLDCIKAK